MKNSHFVVYANAWVLFLCTLVAFSCSKSNSELPEETGNIKPVLTEESIFDFRMVQRVRRVAEKKDKEQGNLLFHEAVEDFKNKKEKQAVIAKFKTSIITFPSSNAYFELGNILLEQKDYLQAEKALNISELLNYPKLSRLYFKLAKLHAAQRDTEKGNQYLKLALEKGFNDYYKIIKDPDFKNLKDSEEYRALIADIKPEETGRKEVLFDVFISKFPALKLPYRIHRGDTDEFDYEHYIPYDFEELLVEEIRKSENKEYSYVGIVDSTAKYIAVMYSAIDAIEADYPAATETYLVTYDKKGNVIDKLLFSCSCSPTLTFTGFIDKKKDIRITEYETTWKYDPSMTEFLDNEILNIANKFVYYYRLTKEGKIKFEKKVETGVIARI